MKTDVCILWTVLNWGGGETQGKDSFFSLFTVINLIFKYAGKTLKSVMYYQIYYNTMLLTFLMLNIYIWLKVYHLVLQVVLHFKKKSAIHSVLKRISFIPKEKTCPEEVGLSVSSNLSPTLSK